MSIREFFNTSTHVIIGKPGELGREIKGLDIEFEVFKDDTSSPNTSKITIYNLNKASSALLQAPGVVIQLFGGFSGHEDLLFLGDVTRATTEIQGPDAKTIIESGDGQVALASNTASVSLKGKTTVEGVLKATLKNVVKDPSKLLKSLTGPTKAKSLPRGFSASGSTKSILRGLARARGFDFFYLDGELKLVDRNQPSSEPAVLLTPETGLIGSPARLTGGTGRGVKLKCMLQGRIRPRRLIKVESASHTGFFMVRKVTHKGATQGTSGLITEVEATEVTE